MKLPFVFGTGGARDKPKDSYGGLFLCADTGGGNHSLLNLTFG